MTPSKARLPLRMAFPSGLILFAILGSACGLQASASPPPPTEAPLPSAQAPSASAAPGTTVVYTKDGDILVWDDVSGESRKIFDSGDVIRVELSDDRQLVAFLRRSIVQTGDAEWREESALWVGGLGSENPRELVSAGTLRGLLGASERYSSNIPEMTWIPGTHRLLYNGWTYLVQAEGESHAFPVGLFSVDADQGTQQVLVAAEGPQRFVVSPDGRQVALLTPTALAFVDADGSNLRPDAMTYAQVGVPGPLFPVGVWTEDSHAFVVTGSFEQGPAAEIGFAIWRVPADGSAPDQLASISRSHPGSVTFSPDGRFAAYIQYTDAVPADIAGWFITQLGEGAGPLAVPRKLEPGYPSLHWSPGGKAFTGALAELCPGATTDSEICDSPISWGGTAAVQWLDATHLLLLTRDPSALFLESLDPSGQMDPASLPIDVWPLGQFVGPESFSAIEAAGG
ncbi:MAG TPA: hypothetical protein VLD63_12395 [Anaerolineales bacterium]|nr:hypothetical protein [Anaerolineales bacterium]